MGNNLWKNIQNKIEERSEEGDRKAISLLNPKVAKEIIPRSDKCTLLHHAAFYGRVALVRHLVDMGADVNAKSKHGMTPIELACYYGHKEVALELAALGADPTILEPEDGTALDWARKRWGDEDAREIEEAFEASKTSPDIEPK